MTDLDRDTAVGSGEAVDAADRTTLNPRYAAAIAEIENRPENAPGADKSWVATTDEAFRRHYQRARRS